MTGRHWHWRCLRGRAVGPRSRPSSCRDFISMCARNGRESVKHEAGPTLEAAPVAVVRSGVACGGVCGLSGRQRARGEQECQQERGAAHAEHLARRLGHQELQWRRQSGQSEIVGRDIGARRRYRRA